MNKNGQKLRIKKIQIDIRNKRTKTCCRNTKFIFLVGELDRMGKFVRNLLML